MYHLPDNGNWSDDILLSPAQYMMSWSFHENICYSIILCNNINAIFVSHTTNFLYSHIAAHD